MADRDRVIALLESIDGSLKQLLARKRAAEPKPVASDRELDSKWGNPVVRFMPRDWTGPSFKDCQMSECPPDLLDIVANTFDYFAQKAEEKDERANNGKPKAEYNRADAARARGWAKRIRDGKHQQRHDLTSPASPTADDSPEWGSEADAWGTH